MPQPGALIHTPVTDFSALFDTAGKRPQCRPFALQYARCQDAYGYPHYIRACQDEYDDLHECTRQHKQFARSMKIRETRKELYKEGKLKEQYIIPPYDSISQNHGWKD